MDKSKWFVRVPFELFESPFWMMKPFSKKEAYVDLFKLANASGKSMYETRGVFVTLEEGEVGTSLILLAERWGWDRETVKRFLVLLVKMGLQMGHQTPRKWDTKSTPNGTLLIMYIVIIMKRGEIRMPSDY